MQETIKKSLLIHGQSFIEKLTHKNLFGRDLTFITKYFNINFKKFPNLDGVSSIIKAMIEL